MVLVSVSSGDCWDWKKKKKTFAVTARPYVGSVINYISILKTLTALVSGMGQKSWAFGQLWDPSLKSKFL